MIVCHCRVVSDRDVAAAVDAGARTLGSVCQSTGAGQDCGSCIFAVKAAVSGACQHGTTDLEIPVLEDHSAAS